MWHYIDYRNSPICPPPPERSEESYPMPGLNLSRAGRWRLLLAGVAVSACATAAVVAIPAFATNEYYECGSCAEVNGPENYVKNNQVINHSGGGICGAVWRKNAPGNYTLMARACEPGGATATACALSQVYGHGEAESESGNGFLRGRQDNFTYCG
jgi:hypothetical protein